MCPLGEGEEKAEAIGQTRTSADIDIIHVVPEADEAPESVCYRGDVDAVKKILWTMLANTDGNGDHWLDEGAQVHGEERRLVVDFSVTGEGGPEGYKLDVVPCE